MNPNLILASWTFGKFLQSAQETLANYGSIIVSLLGVAMVIVGIYQIAKNLISGGKGQTNWITTFVLIILGGALAITGGWQMVGQFASGSRKTLSGMAAGSADMSGSVTNPFE